MNFKINFILLDNTSVTSHEILNNSERYLDEICNRHDLSCSVVIQNGEDEWTIQDELPVLIGHLFLRSVHDLKNNGISKYEFFETNGELTVELLSDEVLISGDYVEELIVNWNEFQTLSKSLAEHSLTFLKTLKNEKFNPDIEFIEQLNID